ncbi:MAG: aldose 1-epimerase family protein [Planctomycetaceae bacterium]|nr:aldose 1-epimerase family protein [Planctomycetaceae bacterium]
MTTKTASLRSIDDSQPNIVWDSSAPLTMSVETRSGLIHTRYGRFSGGASDQVEVVEVDTGAVRVLILPTRGMSIWELDSAGHRFGWQSPVTGPVHPSQVPLFEPSGLGWLEGFDELLVRCGLESNGAPENDAHGNLLYPLHGRIGNLPASSLSIEFDEASGRLELIGEVLESRLFFKRLRLRSRIRFQAGSPDIELLDDVTNDLSKPTTIQLLYHINLGAPVLGEGAVLEAPVETLAPKDALSASEIDQWNQFGSPEEGYAERVYFAKLRSDESQLTSAMLRAAEGNLGFAVSFHTGGLPRFVLWKNTAAESDGYVTGIEPATNYPNQRSYEDKQGRVVELDAGQTKSFRVTLHPLTNAEAVAEMSKRITDIQGEHQPDIHSTPRPGWSPGA